MTSAHALIDSTLTRLIPADVVVISREQFESQSEIPNTLAGGQSGMAGNMNSPDCMLKNSAD